MEIDPGSHDAQLARTSHLPHVMASALASLVGPELAPLTAGGYRDSTRVAASSASIWAPIFLANRPEVLDAVDDLVARLAAFRAALGAGDEPAVRAWWDEGRRRRRACDDRIAGGGVASSGEDG